MPLWEVQDLNYIKGSLSAVGLPAEGLKLLCQCYPLVTTLRQKRLLAAIFHCCHKPYHPHHTPEFISLKCQFAFTVKITNSFVFTVQGSCLNSGIGDNKDERKVEDVQFRVGLRCVILVQVQLPSSLSLEAKVSRKLLWWRVDWCACQKHEKEYFGGRTSCCPGSRGIIVFHCMKLKRNN